MQDDFIDMIEATPKLKTNRCILFSFILKTFLQVASSLITLISWYLFDYFIAGATFLLAFIVMGIIRSKIQISVIPPKQREYQYSDQAIADWYTAKKLCLEFTDNIKNPKNNLL